VTAFYNEIDPFAAAWLRELIAAGHIAPGIVDERDIRDIRPDELAGYTQCHFFAGIGVWSYALRRAGWPDDRPIWTGSCPCQPFSAAGKGDGFADDRHLWPAWQWLIEQCEPECVAGEQVASGGASLWLDLVQADLEGMDYTFGCVPFPAAGVGSPNIRDRAFWLAHAANLGHERSGQTRNWRARLANNRAIGWLAHAIRDGAEHPSGQRVGAQAEADGSHWSIPGQRLRLGLESPSRGLGDAIGQRRQRGEGLPAGRFDDGKDAGRVEGHDGLVGLREARIPPVSGPSPTNGLWADVDWLGCTDGKWRPVEPGTFPLAHGAPARVGRLRGYGNAINAEVATAFIEAVIDHLNTPRASLSGAATGGGEPPIASVSLPHDRATAEELA
jgi:DNA (cytosine-5)-methyltransferase 1